jgi:hypothetical protein
MVEQKPSKLTTRVRFPSPAPESRQSRECDDLAMNERMRLQAGTSRRPCSSVVEHSLGKGEVARSIRAVGTRFSV